MLKKILLLTLFLPLILIPAYAQESESLIPSWIKGVVGFWVEGNITDEKFIEVLEFLIKHEVIKIEGYGKIEENISIQLEDNYELTVTTDKESYVYGETVMISGTLPDYGSDTVVIMIVSPDNMIMAILNVLSDGEGTYSKDWKLISPLMTDNGTYVISVKYKGETLQTTFEYDIE